MPSKRATILYTTLIIAVGLCIEAAFAGILLYNRDGLIQLVINLTKRPYLLATLQEKMLTPQKFVLIRYACYAALVINPVIIFVLYYFRQKIITFISFVIHCVTSSFKSVAATFKGNTGRANTAFVILLLVITARAIYYIIHFELQYDEVWSYNYFTSRPFYISIFAYNNYPLYELSTQLFKWLPFGMKVNLRLPCLLAGLLTCIVLYAGIKNYTKNAFLALAATAIFACMPVTTFYMLYARGVMFQLFFAIVSVFCVLYILKGGNAKKHLTLFVITNVAGLYSMPTHVYFLLLQGAIVLVYLMRNNRALIKYFILNNILAGLLALICYLPVIAGSGVSFALHPPAAPGQVNKLLPDLLFYNSNIGAFFTGDPWGLLILFAATIAALLIFKRFNTAVSFLIAAVIVFCCLPSAIYIIQHVILPERSLAFIGLVIPLCFCLIFYALKDNFTHYATSVLLLAFFIMGCVVSHQHSFLNWSAEKDKKAITLTNLLMQHHVTSCYNNADSSAFYYYYPALEYYYNLHHQAINVNIVTPNSLRYKPFNAADNYDCVVVDLHAADNPGLKNYAPIYTDEEEGFKILLLNK